jgi:hypothetical protein
MKSRARRRCASCASARIASWDSESFGAGSAKQQTHISKHKNGREDITGGLLRCPASAVVTIGFGFAVISSLHSYLILAYAGSDATKLTASAVSSAVSRRKCLAARKRAEPLATGHVGGHMICVRGRLPEWADTSP